MAARLSRQPEKYVLLVLIVVAAVYLRVSSANYSFWLDEWYSRYFASRPLHDLWGEWMVRETNPPLFYTLLKMWAGAGAQSVVGLRLLPIMASALEIALVGAIAWKKYNWWAALTAVVMVTVSFQSVYIGQLLRAYIFATDAALISLAGLLIWIEGHRHRRLGLALYVLGAASGCYFHSSMFLWPLIATLSTIACFRAKLSERRYRLLVQLLLADMIVAGIGSWWIWITYEQLRVGAPSANWMKSLTLNEYFYTLSRNALLIFDGPGDKLAHLFIRLALGASLLLALTNRFSRYLTVTLVVAIIVFKLADVVHPVVKDTSVFWMSIFPVLLISGAVGAIPLVWARGVVVAIIAIVLTLNLSRHGPDLVKQDWLGAIATVAADRDSALIVQASYMAETAQRACQFRYKTPGCPFPIITLDTGRKVAGGRQAADADLASSLAPYRHLYTARNITHDPRLWLCLVREKDRPTWNQPFFEGPYTAAQLARHDVASCQIRWAHPATLKGAPWQGATR